MKGLKLWLLLLSVTGVFYGTSLKYGFSQDDFYFLLISQADSIKDVLLFFSPWHQQGFPFYRPLSTQFYYWLGTSLAGFERAPVVMHIFMLLVQATNGYLVYQLVKKLRKDTNLAIWVGVLYTTAAAHFLSLYYIAATQQMLAALFGLLSLNYFIDNRPRRAAVMFALALLCKESALVVPGVAFLIWQYRRNRRWNILIPYVVVGALYVTLRLIGGTQVQSEYTPVIGPSLISTIRWYFLFGYGAPEILINYAIPGLFINFWRYIRDFGWPATLSSITILLLSLYSIIRLIRSTILQKPFVYKELIFYILWWIGSLALIIWFPDHRYPHYLDLGLIPLLLIIMDKQSSRMRIFLGFLLLLGSFMGIRISERSHWTVGRATIGVRAVESIESSGACQSPGVAIVGPGAEPQEISYVLSLENGLRYLCGKPDMEVYYLSAEALAKADTDGTIPENTAVIMTEGLLR